MSTSDEDFAKPSTESPYYDKGVPPINDICRRIFRDYAKVPEDQLIDHIRRCRDAAWQVRPYPCVGMFRFIVFDFAQDSNYATVLERVKNGATFLDLACAVGQDLRLLAADGAPTGNLYGADQHAGFFDEGYRLFNDRASSQFTFIAADGLAETSALDVLTDKIEIIHAVMFFHLFDIEDQRRAARRALRMSTKQPGATIFGVQNGTTQGPAAFVKVVSGHFYQHTATSIAAFWEEAAREAGIRVRTEAHTKPIPLSAEQKKMMDETQPLGPVFPDFLWWTVTVL